MDFVLAHSDEAIPEGDDDDDAEGGGPADVGDSAKVQSFLPDHTVLTRTLIICS